MDTMARPSSGLLFDAAVGEGVHWSTPDVFARNGLSDPIVSVGYV